MAHQQDKKGHYGARNMVNTSEPFAGSLQDNSNTIIQGT